ncbi:hypothetical protein [Paraburkholderia elongata]|uniref:Uncharacterized protein n=1 Tax=Paraburkholderia elongata TaxID=2675747 RepID=A0A972NQX2_9BURK|nr:hypothetical protein [Paraburkholderia elongata]NPT57382.1 hypothetical protein [Paraburkholderia elongata]
MSEIETVDAAAAVILKLCEDEGDLQTKLERIAYAAAVIKRAADAGIEKINSATEVSHA